MKIFHVPCLEDNYSYLVIDESTGDAAVVNPVDPEKVIASAEQHQVKIKFVLTTHHHWIIDESTGDAAVVNPVDPEKVIASAEEHQVKIKFVLTTHHQWDHAGGNEKIKLPGIKVYGGSLDKMKGCTDAVDNGDKLSLGQDVNILALHTPCHTKGHISYFVTGKEGENPAVFTGDTLVSGYIKHHQQDLHPKQKGTSTRANNRIGSSISKEDPAEDTYPVIDWDASSSFQVHLDGLNKILEDPKDKDGLQSFVGNMGAASSSMVPNS